MVGTIFSISPAFWTGCQRALELRRVFGALLGLPQIIRVGWCSVFPQSAQMAVYIFSAILKHSCPWADRLIPWGGVLQSIIQVRTYYHLPNIEITSCPCSNQAGEILNVPGFNPSGIAQKHSGPVRQLADLLTSTLITGSKGLRSENMDS